MSLSVSYLVTLILAVGTELPADPSARTAAATRYAEDIAFAVGDDLPLAKAVVATVGGESRFSPRISACHCRQHECDNGDAIGAGQLHDHWLRGHSRSEVCADNRLSMVLVAMAVSDLKRRTGTLRRALVAYIGCRWDDVRAVTRIKLLDKVEAIRESAS